MKQLTKKALMAVALLLMSIMTLPAFGQQLSVKNTSIKEGDQVSTISEITFSFDFSEAASTVGVEESALGIACLSSDFISERLLVYKGDKNADYIGVEHDIENENVVGYGYKTIGKKNIVAGQHEITIPLSSPIELTPGEKYTIYMPEGLLLAGVPGTYYTKTTLNTPIVIEVVGKESENAKLKMVSFEPSNEAEINSLNYVMLEFNTPVIVAENLNVEISLYGELYHTSSSVQATENTVTIAFGDIKLLKGKDYIITIPANTIFSLDGTQSNEDAISLIYKGGAFQYMSTGRITPSTNNSVSYFSTIRIPFVFPDGYNMGNIEEVSAGLYEGSLDGERIPLCRSDISDMNALNLDVWNFTLKPNNTYYVVVDKEQIFPTRADGSGIKLKDTTNDEVILVYTTPDVLTPPEKVAMEIQPAEGADNDRLDTVTLNLADYEFENTLYEVRAAVESPVAIFSDGTSETTLPLTFNAAEKKATCTVNRPLEEGRTYTLKVPAGTFAPKAHANLAAVAANDELLLTYTGKAAPATEYVTVTYTVEGVSAMQHEVEKGKAVSFTLTPADELWTVGSVENASYDEASGKYVTEPLDADHEVRASFALARPVEFDYTTEVEEIEVEIAYQIHSDGNNIVVNGVAGGDRIRVYTTAGALMADRTVPEGMVTASISIDRGVYIVAVNDHVYKVRH